MSNSGGFGALRDACGAGQQHPVDATRRRLAAAGLGLILGAATVRAQPAAGVVGFDPLDTPAIPSRLAVQRTLHALAYLGDDRYAAVGIRGHVLLTSDGGQTWRQASVPVSCDLLSVQFVSPQVGFVTGHDGVVLRSTDSGETWVKVLDGRMAAVAMQAQYEAAHDSAWPAASGVEPTPVQRARREAEAMSAAGPIQPLFHALFSSARDGYVVGAFSAIFRTADGGATWKSMFDRVDDPQGYSLHQMAAGSAGTFIVGERGLIVRYDKSEDRFESVPSPYKGSFFGIATLRDAIVVHGLRGNAFLSRDAGASWSDLALGVSSSVTGSTFTSSGRLVMVTQGGDLLVSDASLRRFETRTLSRPMSLNGIVAGRDGRVLVVGPKGVESVALS